MLPLRLDSKKKSLLAGAIKTCKGHDVVIGLSNVQDAYMHIFSTEFSFSYCFSFILYKKLILIKKINIKKLLKNN